MSRGPLTKRQVIWLLEKECNKARWEYLDQLTNNVHDNSDGITCSPAVKDLMI